MMKNFSNENWLQCICNVYNSCKGKLRDLLARIFLNSLENRTLSLVNGLPVRFLEKAGLGFDFTKTQLTGTVLGL